MTTPIPVTFSTNAPAVAKDVDKLSDSIRKEANEAFKAQRAAAEAAAKRRAAIDSVVAAQRKELASTKELAREIERLSKVTRAGTVGAGGVAGRRSFTSENRSGSGGGGGFLTNVGRALRSANGVPFAESAGRYAGMLGGASGAAIAAIAAPVVGAVFAWKAAAVKAEEVSAMAMASFQAQRNTETTMRQVALGRNAAAAGGFNSVGDAAKLLVARGGESLLSRARSMERGDMEGGAVPDAMQGLAAAQLIKANQREKVIDAARMAARLGEVSFSDAVGMVSGGQLGVGRGSADDLARSMIGFGRGRAAISADEFRNMRNNMRSQTGTDIMAIEGTRGGAQAAATSNALDLSQASAGFMRQEREISDPEGIAREDMTRELDAAIKTIRINAASQSEMAAAFANLMAKTGLSRGSQRAQGERQIGAMRAGAGL